ncbi:hypothetical protein BGW42_005426 [Actinomortierella wolfii]|nr:hypothetical protein BGW42_005426 [Actinomortierella wolfii]
MPSGSTVARTSPQSPTLESALSNEGAVSSFQTRTVCKRLATDDPAPHYNKSARLMVEEKVDDEEGNIAEDATNWAEEDESGYTDTDNESLEAGVERYERSLKMRDGKRLAEWIVDKLNQREIFTALQTKSKKMSKAKVYRQLAKSFNDNPPENIVSFKRINELQPVYDTPPEDTSHTDTEHKDTIQRTEQPD